MAEKFIDDMKERAKNVNTVKSTVNWIRVYQACNSQNVSK